MKSLVVAAALRAAATKSLPFEKALSSVFGSISLAAWICLLLPQLVTNYKAQSADALSMAFLVVWMLGDIANLIGALLTHLAPTGIAIAIYFCIADAVLIVQCIYYNTINARKAAQREEAEAAEAEATEDSPLLRRRSSSFGLPGSQRRHETHTESSLEPLRKVVTGEDDTHDSRPWLNNTLGLLAVYAIGIAGWFVSWKTGAWDEEEPSAPTDPEAAKNLWEIIGLVLGYISAVLYLCARIPQIVKNYREKSCEGLALLFFMLSLTGNLTYGVSLVAYSQEKQYIITTIPWLLGSLGTIVEDVVIFIQFRIYAKNSTAAVASSE